MSERREALRITYTQADIAEIQAAARRDALAEVRAAVERLPGMNGRQDAIGGALEVERAAVLKLLEPHLLSDGWVHAQRLTEEQVEELGG